MFIMSFSQTHLPLDPLVNGNGSNTCLHSEQRKNGEKSVHSEMFTYFIYIYYNYIYIYIYPNFTQFQLSVAICCGLWN